jgi:hypothetical protein
MAIDAALEELFDTTVTVAPRSGIDDYTKPTYGSAVTYSAHIERAEELLRTDVGQERVSKRKVFLYNAAGWTGSNMPTANSQLTLPATHPPTTPQIIMVQPVSDENGIHHVVLWC